MNAISEEQKNLLNSLYKNILITQQGTDKELEFFSDALKNLSDLLAKRSKLTIEKAEVLGKYVNPNADESMGQSYTLPGIIASSQGGYDIDAVSKDKDYFIKLQNDLESIDKQIHYYAQVVGVNKKSLNDRVSRVLALSQQLIDITNTLENN